MSILLERTGISWLGVMGELIANMYFAKSKIEGKIVWYEAAPLLSFNPEPGPDFSVTTAWYRGETYKIDVKCTDRDFININCRSHQSNADRPKRDQIDTYLLVKIISKNKAFLESVSHNSVNLWEIKAGFNEYYTRAVHYKD